MHHGRAGVQDIKNSMIAGGIVGVLSELPVLFRSMVITRSDMMAMEQVCLWFYNHVLNCFSKLCTLFCSDTSYLDAFSSIAINFDCQGMHDETDVKRRIMSLVLPLHAGPASDPPSTTVPHKCCR
jgi:hypothetical protein